MRRVSVIGRDRFGRGFGRRLRQSRGCVAPHRCTRRTRRTAARTCAPVAPVAPAASVTGFDLVRQPLDVQQMPRRDVVGGDVAAEAAAAERHRGIEAGGQADRAERRRRVDADAIRGLVQAELEDDLLVARVDRHGVAHAAVAQDLLAALAAFAPVLDDVVREHGTELLDRERMVAADAFQLGEQRARPGRHLEADLLGDVDVADLPTSAGFGSRCGVTSALASASASRRVEEVAALRLELPAHFAVDGLVDDDRVGRRAEHAVVERLAERRCPPRPSPGRRTARCSTARCPGRRRTPACRRCRRRAPAPCRRWRESPRPRAASSAPACPRA